MKALLCRSLGAPDSLAIGQVPSPKPADDQVRIRVRACGVNFPDVLMVAGKYQLKPPMPFSPGAEVCGDIVECGARCTRLKSGQRVIAMCGFGGMAEEVCVAETAAVPVAASLPVETAAGFLLAYGTSYHALKQRATLRAGETLLVLGAAGGVGLAAVELGKLMGARVIAAASTSPKLELARHYGADDLVNYRDANLKESVLGLTDGRGADVIFDPVGGDLFDHCLRAVAWNGRILVVGFAGGNIQAIPANLPLLKGCAVVGVFWGKFVDREPDVNRENTGQLLKYLADCRIKPHIAEVFPLDDGAKALEMLAGRKAMGKIVVRVSS
ncbi:MAG TPA: NADPH:quinone oxidoreductase family protein [Woeseiaceae bacterium]|nr:NADPH:quinone oxidoreductase family protein [Woeseiaceae bacterium]